MGVHSRYADKARTGNAVISRPRFGEALSRFQVVFRGLSVAGLCTIFLLARFRAPEQILFPPCMFKTITGLGCLTCGMTHSFHELAQGRILESFRYHLMGPWLFLVFAFLLLKWMVELVAEKRIRIEVDRTAAKAAIVLFFSVWFGFWVVRLICEAGAR
jgi:hypothetical protein